MGVCCYKGEKKHRNRHSSMKSNRAIRPEAPEESSLNNMKINGEAGEAGDNYNEILVKKLDAGDIKFLNSEIENGQLKVNEYRHGGNMGLLHLAVQRSKHPEVLETILQKGANVNLVETETGNTVLYIACLDLKVDFVKIILRYNPNIGHVNKKGEDIFVMMKNFFKEKTGARKSDMNEQEEEKYDAIMRMLEEYKQRNTNVEVMDGSGNKERPEDHQGSLDRNRV